MRPIIGISCCYEPGEDRYHLARDYIMAVQAGGGIPVILPHKKEIDANIIAEVIDGLVLSGGGDIDPSLFGEEPWPENGNVDPCRDYYELALVTRAIELKMPILGICRGIQVINVAAGGTVCQDIGRTVPNQLKHQQQAPRWHPTHGVNIKKGSTLFNILDAEKLRVNSFHHQMVGSLAPVFRVSAHSGDGVVEAIEAIAEDFFCIGVQFHPENMYRRHPVFQKLFSAHAVASGRFMSNKKALLLQENNVPS